MQAPLLCSADEISFPSHSHNVSISAQPVFITALPAVGAGPEYRTASSHCQCSTQSALLHAAD